jgi:rare lipoprotein A
VSARDAVGAGLPRHGRTAGLLASLVAALLLAPACASRASRPASSAATAPPASEPSEAQAAPAWSEEGLASWYGGGDGFDGKPTASGEIFDTFQFTAAHRQLPLGTIVDVTNLESGATVRVRVNDRGPFVRGRIIDVSRAAAQRLGMIGPGVARVRITIASPAPAPDAPQTDDATAASQTAAAQTGGWAVQVGSFAERDRADRHADRLRAAGFDVYLEPFQGLTRVKVGPVDSRSDAQEKLAQVEAAGFEGVVMPQ